MNLAAMGSMGFYEHWIFGGTFMDFVFPVFFQ